MGRVWYYNNVKRIKHIESEDFKMDLREKQKNEAVERMNELNILDQTIKEFKKEGRINKSEFGGILYWLDEEEMSKVKEFEEEYNALVYHAIKGIYRMCDGSTIEVLDFLYVSAEECEWEMDRKDLKGNYAYVYSLSNCCPYGEFGSIMVKPNVGGLMRVA